MIRYVLKKWNDEIVDGISWTKKSHAEAWIQHHIKINGGLEWRVGGMFKARKSKKMEIVWKKDHKSVNWFDVSPAPIKEYDPSLECKI